MTEVYPVFLPFVYGAFAASCGLNRVRHIGLDLVRNSFLLSYVVYSNLFLCSAGRLYLVP